MKISNKKKVGIYMTSQLVIITVLSGSIFTLRYFECYFLAMLFVVIALLILLYGALKNRFIFEYENSGEVLSIKSYQWLSGNKRQGFEMPLTKILNIEIRKNIFQKHLVILFSSSSGKVLRMDIDITFCSDNQVNVLFRDITKNMTLKSGELLSENK